VTDSPRALAPALVVVGAVVAVISSLGAPLVPAIASAYGTSLSTAQWSLTITMLVGAVATPVVGRLADGPRQRVVVLGSLAAVTVGAVLAALPLSIGWLLAGRALQGVGLGLTPVAIAVARSALAGQRSRRTAAALSITTVAGLGLGYPLAGLVAEVGGVHVAFWAGAAVSGGALLTAFLVLPRPEAGGGRRLDVVGAVLIGAGLGSALAGLSEGVGRGWTSAPVLLLFATAAATLPGWALWERRQPAPLVDVRLMVGRLPLTAHLAALAVGIANYLVITPVTVLVQAPGRAGFGASVVVAGLLLVPFSLASVLGGRVTGALVRRAGTRGVLPLGLVVQGCALVVLGLFRDGLWQVGVVTGLAGLGAGIAFAGLPGVIVSAVPVSETGSAMGLNQVLRYAGFATGSALSATVLGAATPPSAAWPEGSGYTAVAVVGVVICVGTAVATWLLPGQTPARVGATVCGIE
jgi:MFS family permease